MPKSHLPYPPEFRRQMIELVQRGRTPEELAREFEPSAQAIRNWARQAARDTGARTDGLTTEEREEVRRLRREVKLLREERAILAKATAWFARETGSIPRESFFGTRECELLDRVRFETPAGPGSPSLTTSRAGTIRAAGTRRSATCPP